MSFGFGIGDIITAGTLCKNIYDRCKNSRGELWDLYIKTFNLHGILITVENGWRKHHLSEEKRSRLAGLVMPISELLREMESRLLEYTSLGTKTPGICDQIGWAWKGGGADFEKKLDSDISLLSLFYNRFVSHTFESFVKYNSTHPL